MAKKGTRLGRRSLTKQIEKLRQKQVGTDRVSAAFTKLNLEHSKLMSLHNATTMAQEKEISKLKASHVSITDMIGGFKLFILKPDQVPMMRFRSMRVCVEIAPELYSMAFMRGGNSSFRDHSAYARMIAEDISRKCHHELIKAMDEVYQTR